MRNAQIIFFHWKNLTFSEMQWKSYTFLYTLFTAYLTAIYCSFTAYFSELQFFPVKSLTKVSAVFSDKYCKASIFHWNYENLLLTQPIIFLLFSLKLQYFSLKNEYFSVKNTELIIFLTLETSEFFSEITVSVSEMQCFSVKNSTSFIF